MPTMLRIGKCEIEGLKSEILRTLEAKADSKILKIGQVTIICRDARHIFWHSDFIFLFHFPRNHNVLESGGESSTKRIMLSTSNFVGMFFTKLS